MTSWTPAVPQLRAPRPTPWRPVDLVVLLVLLGLALTGVGVAYLGVSATAEVGVQVRWLAGGMGALVLSLSGIASWLVTGLREVRTAQRQVVVRRSLPVRAATVLDGTVLVATPAMTRYHRSDCRLVAGKGATADSAIAHRHAGRRPCGVCEPA